MMNIKTIVTRPIFSIGIGIFIVLFGVISLVSIPVELYPNIAPPVVKVTTKYPGASADAIQKSVIVPLEEAINGVENMLYMTSAASNSGEATISVFFEQGTNADMATVNVQNRVAIGSGTLPAEVIQMGIVTQKQQPSILRSFAIYSPNKTYDENFIANYLNINIKPVVERLRGVAGIETFGANYSIRIWLKPDVMAQYKLIPSDITAILQEQNIEIPAGALGENSNQVFQYTMKYSGRKQRVEEFENLVIRSYDDGEVLRIKDIADVELGQSSYKFAAMANGVPVASAMIYQSTGSNGTEINLQLDDLFEEIQANMPPDMKIITMRNTNSFLFASIEVIIQSLILAILLVFFVVYIFLQDFKATLIPTISIIVSLIGTFIFILLAGFTLNLVTLFALVLVIGTVVDNSIVVVEAVQTRFEQGYQSALKATLDAMKGLIPALFTTTLVFMAVSVPVAFMGGTTGAFYTQFGLTMAVSVGISFLVSVVVSPALCTLMLKPVSTEIGVNNIAAKVRKGYQKVFDKTQQGYNTGVQFFINRKWLVGILLLGSIVLLLFYMSTTKQGFVPSEDTGNFIIDVTAAPGTTLEQTKEIVSEVYAAIDDIPQIDNVVTEMGWGFISGVSVNSGTFFVVLKDWDERKGYKNSRTAIIDEVYRRTAHIKSANIFVIPPGMIPGYGGGGGFEFQVQDRQGVDIQTLSETTQAFLAKLNQRPEIDKAFSSYSTNYPQYVVDIDAAKCKRAGVSPKKVLSVLGDYYGGYYASNFNRFSKVYRVMIQADPRFTKDKRSLDNIFVRVGDKMAAISQFISLSKVYDPVEIRRFNMYNSIPVNGAIAKGYSSKDAILAIKEVVSESMPKGYGIAFSGITREEEKSDNTTVVVFAICIIFIFVLMSMLYESYFIPLAIILSIPFGLLGSFLLANILGLENNIYLQVGLIMLIGLLAKTAILLTEYASQCRHAGMSIHQAAFFAAKVRLRPILMTALTMVFGMFPLLFATGVGANGSKTLGAGVVGGMILGVLALLFIVPVLFITFQHIHEKFKTIKIGDSDDPMIKEELKILNKEE
ncbi:MAG: efflux RND transporter permease subunit [Carboxylicivirga sp.]|jgi:hydrophobe/amphiphile efflux-1 (HAE1) family protein|nr:efflux RND transporter permease subunit [Carboxylicivirga sp.]